MHVVVNGVRLFFDVEGTKLVPDGPVMRQKPTLLMLHGGPGADHSIFRPAYSALSDIAQVIYLDHRGNGRSEDGPRESWNLAQWGDDVRAFCDILGIADPIVLGASFGGMVALAYATRHPAHPSKLVLISTEATGGSYPDRRVELFERFGGPESRRARATPLPGVSRPSRPGLARRLATVGHAALFSQRARSRHGAPRRQPTRGNAVVHPAGWRERQLQHVPGPSSHSVPHFGAGRRRRSDASDRMPGGSRSRADAASGAVRALCRLRPRRHSGPARKRHGCNPGVHRAALVNEQPPKQNRRPEGRRRKTLERKTWRKLCAFRSWRSAP